MKYQSSPTLEDVAAIGVLCATLASFYLLACFGAELLAPAVGL